MNTPYIASYGTIEDDHTDTTIAIYYRDENGDLHDEVEIEAVDSLAMSGASPSLTDEEIEKSVDEDLTARGFERTADWVQAPSEVVYASGDISHDNPMTMHRYSVEVTKTK